MGSSGREANTFRDLTEGWHRAIDHLSFVEPIVSHPAYLRIIGLGEAVTPLLLQELREQPDYWFPELEAVTGQNPVRQNATFDKAVDDWLAWGRREGMT
jgi:hypothetical protein